MREEGLTGAQLAFLKMLTDQRIANIVAAADLIGDMDADTASFLRTLSYDDKKELRKFLHEARPETLAFLTDLRRKEIEDIGAAIELAIALRRTFRFLRWGVATFIAALVAMLVLWEKLVSIFRVGGKQ